MQGRTIEDFDIDGSAGGDDVRSCGMDVAVVVLDNSVVGTRSDGVKVFEFTLQPNGAYVFTQFEAIDHAANTDVADFNFTLKATDADGDTTIDAKIQEDTLVGFGSPTDVAGLAIAQFTAAATAKQAILIVHEGDVSEAFVRCLVTAGNGTSGAEIDITVLGALKHYAPGSHVSTVEEVVKLDIS